MLQSSVQHLDRKKNDFGNKWRAFFEAKFKSNLASPHVHGNWYKQGGPKREYNTIENYKIVHTEDTNSKSNGNITDFLEKKPEGLNEIEKEVDYVKRKMHTTKSSQCNGQCCNKNKNANTASMDVDNVKAENDADVNGGGSAIKHQTTPQSISAPSTSPCACVNLKVECGADCGCDESECNNR